MNVHGWILALEKQLELSAILVSNLGSVGWGTCYHHLNIYGMTLTISTIGEIKKDYVIAKTGMVHKKNFIELGITIDERIVNGFFLRSSSTC
jgi:hypothetical protein